MTLDSPALVLKQYSHPWLAHLSYLLVDPISRTAIVVDPIGDADLYLRDAWQLGAPIRHVFLTQLHPDFEAGHLALRDRAGASVYLGAWARPDYDFTPVKDGDVLEFGRLRLQILELPGRTLEGIGLLVYDLHRSDRVPTALLSGDSLLIGDVGRPDPIGGAPMSAEELAGMLHDSVHRKILPLPDDTLVLPAHSAATPCGRDTGSGYLSSTVGAQRRFNFALHPMSRADFVRRLAADRLETDDIPPGLLLPNRSGEYTWKREIRNGLRPLALPEFLSLRAAGARPLDLRDPADFAGAHLAGSLNVGMGRRSAAWARRLVEKRAAALVVADPGREGIAADLLRRAGLKPEGYLKGGMEALEQRPDLLRTLRRVSLPALEGSAVLDVSLRRERSRRPGVLAIPLDELQARIDDVPRDRAVAVASGDGFLSAIAASLLHREGFDNVTCLVGGLPTEVAA